MDLSQIITNRIQLKTRLYSFLFYSILLSIPYNSLADCTCSHNVGEINIIGYECSARSCPPNTEYRYVCKSIVCSGGQIILNPGLTGDMFDRFTSIAPDTLINFLETTYSCNRIIRNLEGSHIIGVHQDYTWDAYVAGLKVADLELGVNVVENCSEYCSDDAGLTDTDSDGYPDCLDCAPDDPENLCLYCDQYQQDLITQCKGEDNVQFWDPVKCSGRCRQNSNFGNCQ